MNRIHTFEVAKEHLSGSSTQICYKIDPASDKITSVFGTSRDVSNGMFFPDLKSAIVALHERNARISFRQYLRVQSKVSDLYKDIFEVPFWNFNERRLRTERYNLALQTLRSYETELGVCRTKKAKFCTDGVDIEEAQSATFFGYQLQVGSPVYVSSSDGRIYKIKVADVQVDAAPRVDRPGILIYKCWDQILNKYVNVWSDALMEDGSIVNISMQNRTADLRWKPSTVNPSLILKNSQRVG